MKMKTLLLALLAPVFLFAQFGTEIYLFNLKVKNNQLVLSSPKNISSHKGYDSQPFFHPAQPIIYYASFNDSGRSDIKTYNYQTNINKNFTNTNEREYSPIVTPDGKFISCIIQRDNGAQDLGKYPVNGGKPVILVNYMTVGYHAWIDEKSLLLFVLDDTAHNSLHYYNLITKEDKVIAYNPGRSLHKIPGEDAMSFVEKKNDEEWLIQKFDSKTNSISTITKALNKREDLTWLKNGVMLMSDGEKIFSYNIHDNKGWQPVSIEGGAITVKGITRLAVNKANNKITVVMSE